MTRQPVPARVAARPARLPLAVLTLALLVSLLVARGAGAQQAGSLAEQTRGLSTTVANGAVAPTVVGTSAPKSGGVNVSRTPTEITIDREAFEYSA
nr:hypothetical protein [Gemmatimonadaceae bacterium]